MRLSRWVAGARTRLGQAEIEQVADLGVSVIDLSYVDDVNSRNHRKFSESPKVVQLIGRGLQNYDTLDTATVNLLAETREAIGVLIAGSPR